MWDAEGIVIKTEGGYFISNEFGPRVFELDARGQVVSELPLPAHFSGIRTNLALESLSLTPDGRYLFTANEAALEGDGPVASPAQGTLVRIARYDRVTRTLVEYAYRTDPVFAPGEGGDRGLVEIVALSDGELLTMERSFVPNVGNNVRIYRVGLAGAADVSRMDNLAPNTPVVQKTLLADLAELPDPGFPEPLQAQPARILDNFEGMTLGPLLPDGRQILFLISDDNSRDTQTPRILVLAVEGIARAR
jgi:3-phytase/alkaline phosphatase D